MAWAAGLREEFCCEGAGELKVEETAEVAAEEGVTVVSQRRTRSSPAIGRDEEKRDQQRNSSKRKKEGGREGRDLTSSTETSPLRRLSISPSHRRNLITQLAMTLELDDGRSRSSHVEDLNIARVC
jgi:hypothetical protein